MRVLFGPVLDEEIRNEINTEDYPLFEGEFEFSLEMNEEGTILRDALGRYVPIGWAELNQLRRALNSFSIKPIIKTMYKVDAEVEQLNSDIDYKFG